MIPGSRPTSSLPRHSDFDPLSQNGTSTSQNGQISQTLLHDNNPNIRRLGRIARLTDHIHSDAIPAFAFLEREVAAQLEIQRVVLARFGELGLLDDAPADVQLRGLRVEIGFCHADCERGVDS